MTQPALDPEAIELVMKYLAESQILVADAHAASRTRLITALVQLGAKRVNIASVGSYEEAEAELAQRDPRVIVCDFLLGARCTLELLQSQRETRPDTRDCLFVLVTGNGSQADVARAAEEDVDTFILKPYTIDGLKTSLLRACLAKLRPSSYLQTIEKGKTQLFSGQFDPAIETFKSALAQDPCPTLACFYLGQADLMREALEVASTSFERGLAFNNIHYKCLTGLFDLLQRLQRRDDAYTVVRRVAQVFPANPKRLASVLRLAIETAHFDDVEGYYAIFTALDQRPDELTNTICSAMVVTAKHFLRDGNPTRARELFEKALITAAGRTKFIRYAIESLLHQGLVDDAEGFLKRFPADTREGEDFLTAELGVAAQLGEAGVVMKKGKSLLEAGVRNPTIYRTLIATSLKAGNRDWAESLAGYASSAWPAEDFELAQAAPLAGSSDDLPGVRASVGPGALAEAALQSSFFAPGPLPTCPW